MPVDDARPEHMFDGSFPEPGSPAEVGDAALVDAITCWARAAAAAEGRKLEAIAELERRRCTDALHPGWACDDRDAAAAEVSCALTVGHGRALGQTARNAPYEFPSADHVPDYGDDPPPF